MSLPTPKNLDDVSLEFSPSPFNGHSKEFDLNEWHANFKRGYDNAVSADLANYNAQPYSVSQLVYELYRPTFLRGAGFEWLRFVGYSSKHKSLTISLFEGDEVKAIAIRKAVNDDGTVTKWKTFGSKKFIAHSLKKPDEIVFLASGMAELLAFEILGFDYVLLQTDSEAHALERNEQGVELKKALNGRTIVVLLDNDESCRGIVAPLKSYFSDTEIVGLDFQELMGKSLPKGYDFRDFINDTGGKYEVCERLFIHLEEKIK